MKKLSRLIIISLTMLLWNLKAFSQEATLNSNGDTVIAISVNQSKFMLKKYYEVEKYSQLNAVCEKQLFLCDSVNKSNSKVIGNQFTIIKNKTEEVEYKNIEVDKLNEALKIANEATRKQKIYKQIAIIVGAATTGFMTYEWIVKP